MNAICLLNETDQHLRMRVQAVLQMARRNAQCNQFSVVVKLHTGTSPRTKLYACSLDRRPSQCSFACATT